MREHDPKTPSMDEPAGGWQGSEGLFNSPILSIVLCKYTASRPGDDGTCIYRHMRRHPNLECLEFFHSSSGLARGEIAATRFSKVDANEALPLIVRSSNISDDPIGDIDGSQR